MLTFRRILFVQVMNLGTVFLLSDFTFGPNKLPIPILQGTYRDFDPGWFYDTGAKITLAMIGNSLTPHIANTFEPFIYKILFRFCCDRCCKKHLRKKSNSEGPPPKEDDKSQKEGGSSVEYEGGPGGYGSEDDKQESRSGEFEDVENEEGEEVSASEPVAAATPEQADDPETLDPPPAEATAATATAAPEPTGDALADDDVETRHIFQDDLNRAYTGSRPRVWYLYAWYFTNLFMYLLYGGGLPIMYPLGAVFFASSYIIYKWLFFYWYRTAHGFNDDVALYTIGIMKWAVFGHLAMSLLIYTNKRVLSPAVYTPDDHFRPRSGGASAFLRRRFGRPQPFFVAAVIAIVIICYLFWRTIIFTTISMLHRRKKRSKRQSQEAEEAENADVEAQKFKSSGLDDHSDDFFKELSIASLKNHYVRANKEYEMFRTMLNALSYDEALLSEDQAKFFKRRLKARI